MYQQPTLDAVIDRLESRGYTARKSGGVYRSPCPAHGGTNNNLAISEGKDGKVLTVCHSHKCTHQEVMQALGFEKEKSVEMKPTSKKAAFGKKVHKTFEAAVAAYSFGDQPKEPPDKVYRYDNEDGSENLFMLRWNGAENKRIRPVTKVEGGYICGESTGGALPIYNLPKVAEQVRDSLGNVRIIVTEGEKAADAAMSLGFTATTSAFGSGSAHKADWMILDRLAQKHGKKLELIVLPDNDEPGRKYADAVVDVFLTFKSKPIVKVVSISDFKDITGIAEFPKGGDLFDLCEMLDSKTAEEIAEMIDVMIAKTMPEAIVEQKISEDELIAPPLSDFERETVSFLWPDRLFKGKLTLFCGDGSVGKTWFLCYMCAIITSGRCWPDGTPCEQGGVIFFTSEDGAGDTLRPRIEDNGGDPKHIYIPEVVMQPDGRPREFSIDDVQSLGRFIDKLEAQHGEGYVKLVIFDPITAFMGDIDEFKNNQVRAAFRPMARLADEKKFAWIGVGHPKKGAELGKAKDAFSGSIAYTNAARLVWNFYHDRPSGIRRMLLAKNNLLQNPKGLAYIVNDGIISFTDTDIEMDADEYLRQKQRRDRVPDSKLERATGWLKDYLRGGPKPSGDRGNPQAGTVYGDATAEGIKKSTLWDASQELKVQRYREEFSRRWLWSLPAEPCRESLPDDFSAPIDGNPCLLPEGEYAVR